MEEKEQTILDVEPNTKILVTCGNSHIGSQVIKYLLKKNVPPANISTTVRSEAKGEKLKEKGIEIKIADYKNPESLEKAFKGVDRIYMVSSVGDKDCPREKQHLNVIEAAKKCGVKLVVYTSFVNCQNNTNMVADDHKYTEKLLEKSGLNYSLSRNATYFDCQDELFKYLSKEGNNFFYNAFADKKVALVLIRELGEAGASILLKKEPKKIYELSGNPCSFIEMKNAMEKIKGREIKIIDISSEEIESKCKELGFGLYYTMMCKFMHKDYMNGIYDVKSNDLQDLLGHPLTSLEDEIKEVINAPNYFPK